jgi:hypothetical protein
MSTYQEGMVAIFVCLTVVNISIIGVVCYYISIVREENRIERIRVQVLIDSVIEIFESKYKLYDKEDERGIPKRE